VESRYKYTSDGPGFPHCKHKGVETEWETMGFVGAYLLRSTAF